MMRGFIRPTYAPATSSRAARPSGLGGAGRVRVDDGHVNLGSRERRSRRTNTQSRPRRCWSSPEPARGSARGCLVDRRDWPDPDLIDPAIQEECPTRRQSYGPLDTKASKTRPKLWTDLDRSRRHGPRPRDGRRAEGRQRPPRHGDEPGARRVPAVPEGDAARPGRPGLGRPRPLRALLRPLQPHPLHPALLRRVRPRARRPQGAAHVGQRRPRATRSTATPPASRRRPARSARASATRSGWPWPPGASAASSTRMPPLGESSSTTTST